MKTGGRKIVILLFVILILLMGNTSNISSAQQNPSESTASEPEPIKKGTVSGQVILKQGGSMAGGKVMFYNVDSGPVPNTLKYVRVPNFTGEIMAEGFFSAELPVGKYFLFAIKRNSGEKFGRPKKGDYLLKLKEKDNSYKVFSVSEGEKIDLGILEANVTQGRSRRPFENNGEISLITGFLLDMNGNPVENGWVLGFPTPQMMPPPLFVSERSGKDGKYVLRVAGDHTYYLKVREVAGGGQLKEGELVGIYGGDKPIGVEVKAGEIVKEINIKVFRQPPMGPRPAEEQADVAGSPKSE